MPRTWLQIKVELVGNLDVECDPRPGRVFAIGPAMTFERFAEAINPSFGRWDLSHLHLFELSDGSQIGFPDDDADELPWIDHAAVKVGAAVAPGDEFAFTFDLGEGWHHHCTVLGDKVDPRELFGEVPRQPVALAGWGWLPDQYGRDSDDEYAAEAESG